MIQDDITIVGGGIAGLSVALEARRRGHAVTLIDQKVPGRETSHVAAGMLAPLVEARIVERNLLNLGKEALEKWPEYAARMEELLGRSIGYRREGTIITGVEPDHESRNRHIAEEYRQLGLPIEEVDREALRVMEPLLSPSVSSGLYAPSDQQVDNRALIKGMVELARKDEGVEILARRRVYAIEEVGEAIRVLYDGGEKVSSTVVLSAGAWVREIAGIPPFLAGAIRPIKGEILRLGQPDRPLLRHIVRTPEVYLVPKADGTLVVGASTEERGFERQNRVGPLFELLRSAWETLPGVYELPLLEIASGFRPATLDHAPVIGRVDATRLFVAGGFYRHGILLAPFVAQELIRYIETDEEPTSLREFRPDRFDRGHD